MARVCLCVVVAGTDYSYRLVTFYKLRERIPKWGNQNDKICDLDKFELFEICLYF